MTHERPPAFTTSWGQVSNLATRSWARTGQSALQQQDDLMRWAQDPVQSQLVAEASQGLNAMGQPVSIPEQWASPPPTQPKKWHSFPVHITEHKKFCNSDQVRQLPLKRPELEPVFTQLITLDEQALAWEMTQPGSPLAIQTGAAAVAGGGGAGMAMINSNREAGGTDAVPSGNGQPVQGRGPE